MAYCFGTYAAKIPVRPRKVPAGREFLLAWLIIFKFCFDSTLYSIRISSSSNKLPSSSTCTEYCALSFDDYEQRLDRLGMSFKNQLTSFRIPACAKVFGGQVDTESSLLVPTIQGSG